MKKPLSLICAFVVLSCLSGCNEDVSSIVLTTEQCCELYCAREATDTKIYVCASECYCEEIATCGNGVVNDGEECDGKDLNGKTCGSLISGSEGTLSCGIDCKFDVSACKTPVGSCGNGVLDGGELCDGKELNNKTCADLVPGTDGTLSCASDCMSFDLTKCVNSSEPVCGNNVIEGYEKCDGTALNDTKCADLVPGTEGNLKCLSDCSNFDVSECVMAVPEKCGNGVLDPGEDCDGELLSGYTCKSILGPGAEGTLKCSNTCRAFDLSECTASETCGNGARSFNESCDPNEENQERFMCSTLYGDAGGSRTCTSICRWDTETCVPAEHCGNGIFEPDLGEECDPALASSFTDRTCASELGPGADGVILCSNLCKISYAGCGRADTCGDGILQNASNDVNYHETCDSEILNNKKCSNLGSGYTGTLKCLNNCTGYDFSDCHKE